MSDTMEPVPVALDAPDRRDGRVYLLPPEVALAVKVALVTGRPLLLRGEPGSGKSSLAAYIARQRGWRYYEHIVTSRTDAQDLLWSFDSVRRLGDTQVIGGVRDDCRYVEPGVVWWAFARASAHRRGGSGSTEHPAIEPFADMNQDRSPDHAVVLIDEIDKADPDLPNGLLGPLGSNTFVVTETNVEVRKEPPTGPVAADRSRHLVVITTNEERELPQAFLRRCVVIWLAQPDADRLVEIGREHMTTYDSDAWNSADEDLAKAVASEVMVAREHAKRMGLRQTSTAEFLDALRACRSLGIGTASTDWQNLRQFILFKPQQPQE